MVAWVVRLPQLEMLALLEMLMPLLQSSVAKLVVDVVLVALETGMPLVNVL
jgi:hypothetical protein